MTTTITVRDAIDRTGFEVLDYLERDATVPVLTGMQRQGDVYVIPARPGKDRGGPIPSGGVPVVRGEAGGNTHALVSDGPCLWRATTVDPLEVGTLTVPAGTECFLAHPEHGFLGIGAGSYRLRRQREQADVIRTVAD